MGKEKEITLGHYTAEKLQSIINCPMMNKTFLKVPLHRKRLLNGMENLITGGGRKKFVGVLNSIDKSFSKGEY